MTKVATSRCVASARSSVMLALVPFLFAACTGSIEVDVGASGGSSASSQSEGPPPGQGTSAVPSGGVAGFVSSGGSGQLPAGMGGSGGGGGVGASGSTCAPGLTACGPECVDLKVDERHCGACGLTCPEGRECNNGVCGCPNGGMECGGTCVDVKTNGMHCGTCGNPCRGGQSCVNGICACPEGEEFCGVVCADVSRDANHCGRCDNPCPSGGTCEGRTCTCPEGRQACGDTCVDTSNDREHCGMCDKACSPTERCQNGMCVDGGGALLDDGCEGPAQNLEIEQIAVYQTVKIPLMQGGEAVSAEERKADVVAKREALFRVFVKPGSGFTPRQLSARVHIETDGMTETFFSDQKPTISGASTDEKLDSTFQVYVPRDKLLSSSLYSVEVVECGGATANGSVLRPRFPATGRLALGAVDTGVLKIAFVPIEANSSRPDTSETALEPYRAMLLATYPVTDVQMTVVEGMRTSYPINWPGVLDDVRARRQADRPASDVYYYGLLKPTGTLREFCGGGCTTGIGYVPSGVGQNSASARVAVGIGFSDRVSAETLAHEVAHNHGRLHAPCGNPDGPDRNYPYSGGAVGVWGFDFRGKTLVAPDRTDLMGYCNNKWLSDYTYDALLARVTAVSAARSAYYPADLAQPWNVLLLDENGPRWGEPITEPDVPAGEPEPAEILDVYGRVIAIETVFRTEISDIGAFSFEVPAPKPGWHSIRVVGASPLAY